MLQGRTACAAAQGDEHRAQIA
ncbi:hypothetical protein AVEN_192254-1, partial [Araneus ventricosus]